jgi:hypothetical protein
MRSPKPMSSSAKTPDSGRPGRTDHSNARTGAPDSRAGRDNSTRAASQDNPNAGPTTTVPRPDDPGFDTNLIGSLR